MTFAGKKKRIAYGPSIGVNELTNKQKLFYRRMLKGYKAIGLREASAVRLLSECTDIELFNVLDPTFLLDKNQWLDALGDCPNPQFKYFLCYFVGTDNNAWISDVLDIASNVGTKIINISSEGIIEDIPKDINVIEGAGVREFINYIANAECVFTDSFHATAFSIIFNKELLVYKRFLDTDKKSQNSRLYDVLNRFGLVDRLVSGDNAKSVLSKKIDYGIINNKLEIFRTDSIRFIEENIKE